MMLDWSETVRKALFEDIGRGDITTQTLIPSDREAEAVLVAREDLVVCGMPLMVEVFRQLDRRVRLLPEIREGEGARAGNTICHLQGPARALLSGERVALNFFQNLSAVAAMTRRFVECLEGTGVRLVDTRKTTPGLRLLQKYAVRVGGGFNHRMGLDDGVLIKENHIAVVGSITEAVRQAQMNLSHLHRIEVECERIAQVREALEAGASVLLLDNMDPEMLREAVMLVRKNENSKENKTLLEASGSVTLENIRAVAETGVDLISVGSLTHSAGSRDVSLLITVSETET